MNLQFTNKGGNFVSEFEVTSDFNLHIEGVRLSDMHIYQKTAGGSYAKVTDFPSERSQDRVADFDFASLVYPKFIKVVCVTEPTYAEITTDGEVTEIKSQSKEVEITANGVTEIAPDNGFGYLSGVKVNVNVPQSGGDAPGTGGGGSDVEYLNVSINEMFFAAMAEVAGPFITQLLLVEGDKYSISSGFMVMLSNDINNLTSKVKAIAIDKNMTAKSSNNGDVVEFNFADMLNEISEAGREMIASIPRITKEQFYNPETFLTL